MRTISKIRKITLVYLLVITMAGFASKLYTGIGASWFNNSLAGMFYEVFWCLVVLFITPTLKPIIISAWVLILTFLLEFFQLWHPQFLELIRKSFMGSALLGNSFNCFDFPYYIIGCVLGFFLIATIKTQFNAKKGKN